MKESSLHLEQRIVFPLGNTPINCPACGQRYTKKPQTRRTGHHILPQQHFGRHNKHGKIDLCQACHTELHKELPLHVVLGIEDYVFVLNGFLDFKCLQRQQEKTYKISTL